MVHLLLSPSDLGQIVHGFFPLRADAHALVKLKPHICKRGLPDVSFLELSFDFAPKSSGDNIKSVDHSYLRVLWVHARIGPDVVKAFVNGRDSGSDTT